MDKDEEIDFYIKLLEKELEVIKFHALKLPYYRFEIRPGEIIFHLLLKEDSQEILIPKISQHIEEGNDFDAEPRNYVLGVNSDKKRKERLPGFSGKPYWFSSQEKLFKIKDYYSNGRDNFPERGVLSEDLSQKEEEKKRQLQALRKARTGDVVGRDLCYYLFKPWDLPKAYSQEITLSTIFQKDKNGKELNYSENQKRAISNAINLYPLSLIQGPPGTGKTTVITEIVFQLLNLFPDSKILITSQTNNAVDQVLENLIKSKIPVLRLFGRVPVGSESVREHTIDRKLEGWKKQIRRDSINNFNNFEKEFRKRLKSKNIFEQRLVELVLDIKSNWKKVRTEVENISTKIKGFKVFAKIPEERDQVWKLFEKLPDKDIAVFFTRKRLHKEWITAIDQIDEKSMLNSRLVNSVNIIGATCNHIASKKYEKYHFEFDFVIMDESGKATTAEALVPITMGKKLILVGDHRQLKPTVTNNEEVKRWLKELYRTNYLLEYENDENYIHRPSLFELIIREINPDYKSQLTECRRSSKEQVELTSKHFYEAFGDLPIIPVPRPVDHEHGLPLAVPNSVFFIDSGTTKHEQTGKSKSFSNKGNAELIVRILRNLDKYPPVKEFTIGVITAYSAQSKELDRQIRGAFRGGSFKHIGNDKAKRQQLTVNVVDRFQGLERDIIILDLVKAGQNLPLGFLEVPNRINVALSRQKKLLLIIGDYQNTITAKNRLGLKEVALQAYLKSIRKECIIPATQVNQLFK